ncbi:hypothetical protein PQH03_03230 [Ralstonia insidiosa]|jgi:hypothetical protein|uniref:hypothetical protein n=1 Tax=Ralstonia TaxID=48736 RepID=UPI000664C295|nr:hypothetical protein [Ralstonia insidiosa]KMW45259.1 lipoprotein [Ralstonia sp. MD27]MBX3774490.1 hypothetical protein [Ralstonia pickettii]NOZ16406.1 hypothetical protein [Betaproteobacteria bacterium]MBA9859020.1 hypothetical protein [Ralstonia insidiosa]MBA9873504.1 hypothetical protein [Ralstonia insidiosa]
MKITSMLARAGLCGSVALTLAGCMASTPAYDAHFGDAVRTVRAMQTLNPNASMNTDPVTGVDGRAATSAMDRYNGQFRTPQSDLSAFKVGVGAGNSLDSMGK